MSRNVIPGGVTRTRVAHRDSPDDNVTCGGEKTRAINAGNWQEVVVCSASDVIRDTQNRLHVYISHSFPPFPKHKTLV